MLIKLAKKGTFQQIEENILVLLFNTLTEHNFTTEKLEMIFQGGFLFKVHLTPMFFISLNECASFLEYFGKQIF